MKNNIDQPLGDARSIPVSELCHLFLKRNPPKDKRDINNIRKAFEILLKLFPNIDTGSFTANHLIVYKNNLPEMEGKTASTH